jgi:hypothetical protein
LTVSAPGAFARRNPDLFQPDAVRMYAVAVARLHEAAPEIGVFIFSTNDSATGLPCIVDPGNWTTR